MDRRNLTLEQHAPADRDSRWQLTVQSRNSSRRGRKSPHAHLVGGESRRALRSSSHPIPWRALALEQNRCCRGDRRTRISTAAGVELAIVRSESLGRAIGLAAALASTPCALTLPHDSGTVARGLRNSFFEPAACLASGVLSGSVRLQLRSLARPNNPCITSGNTYPLARTSYRAGSHARQRHHRRRRLV